MTKYRRIQRYYNAATHALNCINSKLSADRTLELIERLALEIVESETDESVWWLESTWGLGLDELIIGAYWWTQDNMQPYLSDLYDACAAIYTPNFDSNDEGTVYQLINAKVYV